MARPVRFYPPGVLFRSVRHASRPIPDSALLGRRLRARLTAVDAHVVYVRVDRDTVEVVFWTDGGARQVSSLLNVLHSKLSRDINEHLGTPGFVNFAGTSEPLPLLSEAEIVDLCLLALAGRTDDVPLRFLFAGPRLEPFVHGQLSAERSRRVAEDVVHMLRSFVGANERLELLRCLSLDVRFDVHEVRAWRDDSLASRPPIALLQHFLAAQRTCRSLYRRSGRALAQEYGPGQCPLGMHHHRRLTSTPERSVEEPVVSLVPGVAEPPSFCSQCEGLAARHVNQSDPRTFDADTFIRSMMRPSNGRPRGGGGRLDNGLVSVRAVSHPRELEVFLCAQSARRERCMAEAHWRARLTAPTGFGSWEVELVDSGASP